MSCFSWIILIAGGVFLILSLIRWFEQVTEAVRNHWWNKTALLILCPFAAWFYASKVVAGRPTPVPHHQPVRGFGSLPKSKPGASGAVTPVAGAIPPSPAPNDLPPPGTPPEFLVKPQVPPRKPRSARPPVDPEKIAKLREKMREQGMMGEGD